MGNKEEGLYCQECPGNRTGSLRVPRGKQGLSPLEVSCPGPFLAAGMATKGPFMPSWHDPHYAPSSEVSSA